jgi:NAD(P)-dependent dehydrogenase (short-subunit alcohol dehydrogenase family)
LNNGELDQQIRLDGQVAIVTGGGRGIGRAMVSALAEAGAAVAVVARSADELAETVALVEKGGGRAIAVPADVTDERAVEQMAAQVEGELGPVDLLVNNAGVAGPNGPTWEVDRGAWWRCLEVNLRGPYLFSSVVLPGMVRRRRGRIVITSSGAGLHPWAYASAYAVSKCAVIRLAENLAAEVQEYGISVFAISPGFVRTAMTEGIAESPEDAQWFGGRFRQRLAQGQGAPPERAAGLVVALASGKADPLSGCFISIRDDLEVMVSRVGEIQRQELYTLRLRS